jgi:hypothetical protein
MNVTMSKESKRIITLEEAHIARAIISGMKEDESTVAEYAKYAVNAACKGLCHEVFKASAEIAKNCRINDLYFEGSKNLDVWIEATAQTSDEFCVIGAYLSDIWSLDGDNSAQIAKDHMYVRIFTENH